MTIGACSLCNTLPYPPCLADASLEPCFQGMGARQSYSESRFLTSKLVRLRRRSGDSHGGWRAASATRAAGEELHGCCRRCAAAVGESLQEPGKQAGDVPQASPNGKQGSAGSGQRSLWAFPMILLPQRKQGRDFTHFSWSSVCPAPEKDTGYIPRVKQNGNLKVKSSSIRN